MRLFHELVFDRHIEGSTGLGGFLGPLHWSPVMGNVETLRFMIIADEVSGSSLALNVAVGETPNLTELLTFLDHVLPNEPLTPGATNVFNVSLRLDDTPASYAYFLYVSLNGDPEPAPMPRAHVRIWVTGRGRA